MCKLFFYQLISYRKHYWADDSSTFLRKLLRFKTLKLIASHHEDIKIS